MKTSVNPAVEIRRSDVHGTGLFARADLPRFTLLGRYEGRRHRGTQLVKEAFSHEITYLFALSDGTMIDGGQGGNALRYLNHACAPNCSAHEEVEPDGSIVVDIYTRRTVRSGVELFLDYALVLDDADEPSAYMCRCLAPRCRGTMAGIRTGGLSRGTDGRSR